MYGRHELLFMSTMIQPHFSNHLPIPPRFAITSFKTTIATQTIMSSHFALVLALAALVILSDMTPEPEPCSHPANLSPPCLRSLEIGAIHQKATATTIDGSHNERIDL